MRRGIAGGFVVCVAAAICIAIVEAEQPSAARANAYVVQFTGPVLESWKTALGEAGADLQDFVPPFGFRVRMSPDAAARVRRLTFVSSVEALRAEHTLAPRLRRNGAMPYIVRLERGAIARDVEAALRDAGAQVLRRGSQLMIVADSALLDRLAGIDGLATIENFTPRIKHNEYGGGVIMGSNVANANGFNGSSQTIAIADTGLGTGTAAGAHANIASSRITSIFNWPGAPDFCYETISNDGAIDLDSGHGTHVATAAVGAGNGGGAGRGTAPAANLVFQAIENYAVPSFLCSFLYGVTDGYYLVGIPDNVGDLYNQAYLQNARVHSDSWGSEVAGAYTADSANTDAFVWAHRDLTVTFSAGNSGTDANADGVIDGTSINAPGSAKNVITVGASENDRQGHYECDPSLGYNACASQGGNNNIFTWGLGWPTRYTANPIKDDSSAGNAEQMAAFSSRGPTSDGRIKPDVVAPGTWNLSGYADPFQQGYDASPNATNGAYQYDGWGFPLSQAYKYMGGTSMSAPLVAGGAAVVRDFYWKSRSHNASAALVKAVLINSAVDLLDENNDGVQDNFFPIPNMHEGWGRVDLVNATDASDQFYDENLALSTATSTSFTFDVPASGAHLKATLAWTDFAASTSAAISLVNDLDLTVVAPDGTTYMGNAFSGGWSVTGGSADRLNNVENAYVFAAAAGTWTITVSGYNVPQGPQPFALVVDSSVPGGTALPQVRVTADDGQATEAGLTGGVLRVTRTGDTGSALEVAYNVSGTAVAGGDYVALSGFVTIPEGSVDATIAVNALDDQWHEAAETVVVTVVETPAYLLGTPSAGVVTIVSEDPAPDLVITALTVPALGAPGTAITANATTRNQGAGVAPESQTGFYLSLNGTWSADDVFIGEQAIGVLTPGGQAPLATSLVIPASVAPGVYYVMGRADTNQAVIEANEMNNIKPSSARINVGPDLLVSALTAPTTAAAGEPIVVTDTTKNQGAASIGSTVTAFYLSINTALDASDQLLGSRTIAGLNGGMTDVASTSLVIPASTSVGTYYVLAQADNGSGVAEYLETNNVRSSAAMKIGADLSVTALTAPTDAGAGQSIIVNETTTNLGAADSEPAVTRYYLSLNATLEPSDTLLGSRVTPHLEAGTASATTVTLTIPAVATGAYYLIANADDAREIVETNEVNNLKKVSIEIGPDLSVSYVDPPAQAGAGGSIDVINTTANLGGGAAAPTLTSFYLSANSTLDASDVLIGTRAVPSLTGGQTSQVTTPMTVPAGTAAGTYYVIVKADHDGVVTELSEANNTRSASMKVGPDLVVLSTFSAPTTVVRGVAFTVTETTQNNGGGPADTTTTAYYLSVNNTLDASDVLLSGRIVGVLAAGAQDTGSSSVVVPATQATGNYYIIAKTDNGGVVMELLETNNTRARTIKVNP